MLEASGIGIVTSCRAESGSKWLGNPAFPPCSKNLTGEGYGVCASDRRELLPEAAARCLTAGIGNSTRHHARRHQPTFYVELSRPFARGTLGKLAIQRAGRCLWLRQEVRKLSPRSLVLFS